MASGTVQKYRSLVKRLYEKTNTGSLTWEQDLEGEISCIVGETTISLRDSTNSEGEPLEIIDIKAGTGKIVDSFNDEFVSGEPTGIPGTSTYYELMVKLHETAKRKASGLDETLDKLLDDLS